MNYSPTPLLLLASLLLASCDQATIDKDGVVQPKPQTLRSESASLSETYATFRSEQVQSVSYELFVDLTDEEKFHGEVGIHFELTNTDSPLTIDFIDGEVNSVSVGSNSVSYEYNGWFISIDPSALKAGQNQVTVNYSHAYSTDGAGLYRFTDPEDGRDYLYTDFEPYDANRLFPAFDQPDLKASYELEVLAPCGWQVITSVREASISETDSGCQWAFPQSARYSTYIFPLHAGDYASWESTAGEIPLRLFARQSLMDYIVPEDWFGFTQHGFGFFQDYFDIDYPYGKYDQIIVPDFNAGAMENVGAVTFSERYIKRGGYTQNDKDRINSVVLHEMAHMWFGNLVTMRWWNGLWLNESFATYMSFLAEAAAPDNDSAWQRFYQRFKLWAYETDQQVTTHAIELPVDNSDSAFTNFDGITYGKGASALKQLSFLLGEENFRQGVSNYLKEKSHDNSELEDFTGALAKASNRNLDVWSQEWLYQKGLNSVTANYECDEGEISSFELTQSAPDESPTIREHQLKVALFSNGQLNHVVSVNLAEENLSVDNLVGQSCPDFVYPNYEDWAYIKVSLPQREFLTLAQSINKFQDSHLRSMLWVNLWEAVRDAQLPLSDYANILLDNIAEEGNDDLLLHLLSTVDGVSSYYHLFGEERRAKAAYFDQRYEQLAWIRVTDLADGSDTQKAWFDSYVRNAKSSEALGRLAAALAENVSVPGLALDQDRRWAIVKQLNALTHDGATEIAIRESERDLSDNGKKAFLAAQIASPDLTQKAEFLEEIQNLQSELTMAEKNAGMQNLFQVTQPQVGPTLLEAILSPIETLDAEGQQVFKRNYYRYLIRGYCTPESTAALQGKIDTHPNLSLGMSKALKIALQEDERCLSIRAIDTES